MTKLYVPPESFIKLQTLDRELIKETGNSLDDHIGIHLEFNGYRYDRMTPDDSIVFASTGMNGDHFAFDTKKGTIHDLEEAPILFVQPMDSQERVKLVAGNIRELFSVYLTLKEFYVLEGFDWYESREDFINDYNKNIEDIEGMMDEFKIVAPRLIQLLNISAMEDVFSYISEIRKAEG